MRISIIFLLLNIINNLSSQRKIFIFSDSTWRTPLVGAKCIISNSNQSLYADLEGTLSLENGIDSFSLSMLGYYPQTFSIHCPSRIFLRKKTYLLKGAKVAPINSKSLIQKAFDSFYRNHVPFPYSQRVFYREEFLIDSSYLRFQEMDMSIIQYPKSGDKRKYYISNSFPQINRLYRIDNYKQLNKLKLSLGKWIGNSVNFSKLSLYSYVKGVNILNFIFTALLEDEKVQYQYLGIENVKGYNCYHIRGEHFSHKNLIYTTNIFIEENTYAITHFAVLATDYDVSKKLIDFKAKTALWLFGVQYKINRYYAKIQFEPNEYGIWTVEDHMLMLPFEINKKFPVSGSIHMNYHMSRPIKQVALDKKSLDYNLNLPILENYTPRTRFSDSLSYSIPLVPIQKKRILEAQKYQ